MHGTYRFRAVLALVAGITTLGVFSPALAGPPACTCNNLEQLQQEFQNAIYLEGFFRSLAAELQQWEVQTQAEKDQGRNNTDITRTGLAMYHDKKSRSLRLPFPAVDGYTGPESVPMAPGTCNQSQADLDAMENGSQCEAIADMALAHELGHRDICNQMGAEAYWSRLASDYALEEAARYKTQVANLKSEIARVLDAAEVRLTGEWMHTLSGDGVVITYFYSFDSGDIKLSEKTGDQITFTGTGTTSNQIVSMTAPGVSCKASGAVTNMMEATLTTDGLKFGIDLVETNTGGDLTLVCNGGTAMAMPSNEVSSGSLAAGLPLKMGDTKVENAWAEMIRKIANGAGMSLTGDPTTSVTISCPAP